MTTALSAPSYSNFRILNEPRMCGTCVDSPNNRPPDDTIRPAYYSADVTEGRTTVCGERFCAVHLPTPLRRQLPREALLQRYRHLVQAMQHAAILSEGEAIGAIRDLADHPRYGGAEAVVHYGGPKAVILGAIRCRGFVRRNVQSGRIIPYRPCKKCTRLTTASDQICSQACR